MKNMSKKIVITAVIALALAACGRTDYQTVTNNNNSVLPETTTVDPITNFTTKWISEANNVALTGTERRSLANFLGYNTSHDSNNLDCVLPGTHLGLVGYSYQCVNSSGTVVGGCNYGYVSDNYNYGGACFTAGDTLANYFPNNTFGIVTNPAPKDTGNVSSYKIRFAFNVDEATRAIKTDNAYLDLTVDTSYDTVALVFDKISGNLSVSDAFCLGLAHVPCTKITATLSNTCGDVKLVAYELYDTTSDVNELISADISFYRSAASYKLPACYYNGKLPSGLNNKSYYNTYPSSLPVGIDTDTIDPTRGQIFKTATVADFVETEIN